MSKKIALFLMAIGFINACKNDEDPEMVVFTLEVGEGYLPQPGDNWIIISSSTGELLDYQLLQAGVFMLQTKEIPADNKMNVSLLSRGTSNPNINFFSMNTYSGIDVGDSWSLQAHQVNPDPIVGEVNVEITNLPPVEVMNVTLSKEQEGLVNRQGSVTGNGVTSQANLVVPISQSQKDILISVTPQYLNQATLPNFESRYYWLRDLTDGQQLSLDFETNFLSQEEQLTVDIPDDNGTVVLDISGFQDLDATYGAGFIFTSVLSNYPIYEIAGSFNRGFNFYETSFTINNSNGSTIYRKVGSAPSLEDLSSRSLDFQMLSRSFNNYTFEANEEFQIIENGWFHQIEENGVFHTLSWNVYADRNEVNFPVLIHFPEELVIENPVLSTDNLDNTHNRFIYQIDGGTYDDFLDIVIRQPMLTKKLREEFQVTKF